MESATGLSPALEPERPTVTFDPALRNSVESMDIDLEKYADHLRVLGLNEQQIGESSVHFTNTGRFLGSGVYLPDQHRIEISVPRTRNIDKLLKHEAEHAADDALGQITTREQALAYVNNVGIIVSTAALTLAGVGTIWNHEVPEHKLPVRSLTVAGAIAFAAGQLAHKISPAEQRARKASEESIEVFVSVKKKPLYRQLGGLASQAYSQVHKAK